MLLREIKQTQFNIFTANVKVRSKFYSQIIQIQISARNTQEAKRLIQAQYGMDTQITGLRMEK
jgi:predicted enzyme related to lactoylglutathione lyase